MTTIRHVEVVVPACNEQKRIGACLDSLVGSVDCLRAGRSEISAGITVVLNCCTDDTPDIVRRFPVRALTSDACSVGTARRLGAADAIDSARRAGFSADELWIACTDADTLVPADWLRKQVEMAESGIEAVIGTVTPDDLSPEMYERWLQHHDLREGHDHVHGANLGFGAGVYLRAGGFLDDDSDEDVGLVERIRAITSRWAATHRTSVRTSGRTDSRVDGGFASYLSALEAEPT